MTPHTVLNPAALFKQDSARRIDRSIDYFGGAAAEISGQAEVDAAAAPPAEDDKGEDD